MSLADLVFSRPPITGAPHLVFGDTDDGPPSIPDTTLHASGKLSGLRGHIGLVAAAVFRGGGRISGLRGSVALQYDSRVYRYREGSAVARHNPAVASTVAAGLGWGQSAPHPGGTGARWQAGRSAAKSVDLRQNTTAPVLRAPSARWQRALGTQAAFTAVQQHGLAHSVDARLLHQVATHLQRSAALGLQAAIELHLEPRAHWTRAEPVLVMHQGRSGASTIHPSRQFHAARWQTAMRPLSGRSPAPQPPLPHAPCYLPDPNLVFEAAWSADAHLVFVCERHEPGPEPEPQPGIVVPIRRVYMTVNNISLRRVAGNIALPAASFSMSIDVDSWTWSWSATMPSDARQYLVPVDGAPVEVEASVNGVPYRLAVEAISRDRTFAKSRISVRGRGLAAVLDAPYAPTLNFGNTAARTAQQLMADVLTVNGVGIGWDVDWGLTDWLVPGNIWTHQGSYISAINQIASAAGGYVQPHATLQTLRILPRYPAGPWDWATVSPDFELPSAVVTVEGIEWATKPGYNRAHVSGVAGGIQAQATRTGTAGNLPAPMVTDSLITHADAARQRALQVLADVGAQARVTLKMPVLAETGIITPGKFIRYTDGPDTRIGIVRGTSLDWSVPTLRQTLDLETHGTD